MPNTNKYQGIFHNHGFNNAANSPVIYYPNMLFDSYQLNFSLEIDEASYFKSKKTNTLTNDFDLPDLDFEVVNNSLANYEMKSSSEFDFYNVELRYVLQSADYRIFWQIYGKSSKVTNFVLPNIKAMVFDDISNFSLDSLKQSSKIYNYEGLDNYEDFIHTRINNKSEKLDKVTLWEFVRK